jgi:hypothetical protein
LNAADATTINPELKFADVHIISNEQCLAWYGELVLNDNKICISTDGGTVNICSVSPPQT